MIKKIIAWITASALVAFLVGMSKRIHFPGFQGIPLYDVVKFFFHGVRESDLNLRASAVAYSLFMALFPTIIFFFTLIPYIPIENFQESLFSLMSRVLPENAFSAAQDTIRDIITKQRGGLLSIGFISALYFSTSGFNALISAFNATSHDVEQRTAFQQRLASLYLVIICTLLMTMAIGLIIFSEYAMDMLFEKGQFSYYVVQIGRLVILFALCYLIISFTYYLGPSRKSRWKFASAGSMLATWLMVITSLGFTFYVNNFGNYNKLYGSIGTLIVVLLWIYINSLVILVGFELNASIHQAKLQQHKK